MAEKTEAGQDKSTLRSVYDDATYFIDNIVKEYGIFQTILDKMRQGNATVELRKRYFLRAIDETWVNIIEDTLPALDIIIRNPSRFIEDREEIVAVEQARKVAPRTLQHLAQHTDFISRIEGDTIIPKKLLNVYKEETVQTYENKFINTLISRLYAFVNRRYEIALNAGQDEKTTSIEFKDAFNHDEVKVKMDLRIEISEPSSGVDDRVERNYSYTTDLWHRVERLNSIVTNYSQSDFVTMMGRSYIRPPVMRTNAILKNKNMRQCLQLWQFIETYESAGYSMLVQENLENIDEDYIKELYATLALQYMIFRYNIRNEFEADNTLASEITENELKPRIIDELGGLSSRDFDLPGDGTEASGGHDISDLPLDPERIATSPGEARYAVLTPEDRIILQSLDVAMDALDKIRENDEEFIYDHGSIPEPEPVPERVIEEQPEPEPELPDVPEVPSAPEPEKAEETSEAPAEEAVEPAEEAVGPAEETAEPAEEAAGAADIGETAETVETEMTEETEAAEEAEAADETPREAPADEYDTAETADITDVAEFFRGETAETEPTPEAGEEDPAQQYDGEG